MNRKKFFYVILSLFAGYAIVYSVVFAFMLLVFLILPLFTWNYEFPLFLYHKVTTYDALWGMYQMGTFLSLIATVATLCDSKENYK